MKKLSLLINILLLTGCSYLTPTDPSESQTECRHLAVSGVESCMMDGGENPIVSGIEDEFYLKFCALWGDYFGTDEAYELQLNIHKLETYWYEGDCFRTQQTRYACVAGTCLGPETIWVALRDGEICHTALAHELYHWAFWVLDGQSCDHEDECWMNFDDLENRLCEGGA